MSPLRALAPGVLAFCPEGSNHDQPNLGVVIAEDGLTFVDAGVTPGQAARATAAVAELIELPVRRLALTSSHIGHVGGSSGFPLAAVWGSEQTSHHLDQTADPTVWARLHPALETEFSDLVTRPVSHAVREAAHLCPASIAVPVGGQQFENLVVQVPAAGVVFTGALASFGVTPLGFEADFPVWIDTLEQMAGWGTTFVPAHGPVGSAEDLMTLRSYFEAVIAARGTPAALAAGPWDTWSNPEFHAINVERAAMLDGGDPSPPPALLALLAR